MAHRNPAVGDIRLIAETYVEAAIRTIENKLCNYCHKGKWRVITIICDGRDATKSAFDMSAAVQCRYCQEIDSRTWEFDPFESKGKTGE